MQFPVDLGGGFTMVQLAEHHAPALNRATIRNLSRLREWEAWAHEAQTLSRTETHIGQRLVAQAQGHAVPCLIMRGPRVVGTVDLRIDAGRRSGELGYWLDKDVVGRGLATGACELLLRHASELGVTRLRLRIAEGNARSIAVAHRLGFALKGTAEHMLVGRELHPMLVYERDLLYTE